MWDSWVQTLVWYNWEMPLIFAPPYIYYYILLITLLPIHMVVQKTKLRFWILKKIKKEERKERILLAKKNTYNLLLHLLLLPWTISNNISILVKKRIRVVLVHFQSHTNTFLRVLPISFRTKKESPSVKTITVPVHPAIKRDVIAPPLFTKLYLLYSSSYS